MTGVLEALRDILWGWPVLLLILAAGMYFSYESCFFQLFHPIRWLKAALGSGKERAVSYTHLTLPTILLV